MFVRHLGCGVGHLGLAANSVENWQPSDYQFDIPVDESEGEPEGAHLAGGLEPLDDDGLGEEEEQDYLEEESNTLAVDAQYDDL